MLGGFLRALGEIDPGARVTGAVPFDREALERRFPGTRWHGMETAARRECIAACDVWLGLGGSPFQHARSRWFVDHLEEEASLCRELAKPMWFLGIGVQTQEELADPAVRSVCAQARGIWTRDGASAKRIEHTNPEARITAAADLAHVHLEAQPPPAAEKGTVAIVANFDFGEWPGRDAALDALESSGPSRKIWLAQESRELPGAEHALYRGLPEWRRRGWELVSPDRAGASLEAVIAGWPGTEILLTSRYHAALTASWAGSRVVVIGTNEKLRAAAEELGAPLIESVAEKRDVERAIGNARHQAAPRHLAATARNACRDWYAAANDELRR